MDFALIKKDQVTQMIEVKTSNHSLAPSLLSFHKKYGYPAVQIVKNCRHEMIQDQIMLLKAENFLKSLWL